MKIPIVQAPTAFIAQPQKGLTSLSFGALRTPLKPIAEPTIKQVMPKCAMAFQTYGVLPAAGCVQEFLLKIYVTLVMQPGKPSPERAKKIPPAMRIVNRMQPVAPPPISGGVMAIMPILKNEETAKSDPSKDKKICRQFNAFADGAPSTNKLSIFELWMRAPSKNAHIRKMPARRLHQSATTIHAFGGPPKAKAGVEPAIALALLRLTARPDAASGCFIDAR